MKKKKIIINLEKELFVVGLCLIIFLRFLLFLDIILNGNDCCNKHIDNLSCICKIPKFKILRNISEIINWDFNIIILILSLLFGCYTFYYLIKTRKIKRSFFYKIFIIIGILCILYFILSGVGNLYYNDYFY